MNFKLGLMAVAVILATTASATVSFFERLVACIMDITMFPQIVALLSDFVMGKDK